MTEYIVLSDKIDVMPVLDIGLWWFVDDPEQFSSTGDIPIESQARYSWWKKGMASLGITDLEPLPGTITSAPLVPIETLTDMDILGKLTHIAFFKKKKNGLLEDVELSELRPDHIFTGGYRFTDCDEIIFDLMCCTEFEQDLKDWQDSISYRGHEWTYHGMGHPWSWVRYVDEKLQFVEPAETMRVENPAKIYIVEPILLAIAVAKAEQIYLDFEQRFRHILATLSL